MERTRLTLKQKLDNTKDWIWGYVSVFDDSELQYGDILYKIGYTIEEIEEELKVGFDMSDEEAKETILQIEKYNDIDEV